MYKLTTLFFSVSALFAGGLYSSTIFAGERVDKELSADGVKSASIEVERGEVKIIGTSGSVLSVEGELDDKVKQFVFERSGNLIRLKVKTPHKGNQRWHEGGSELTLKIPEHIKVSFQGVSTDVVVGGLSRGTDIETVSGDIKATDLEGRIELTSVSGDVKAESLSGKILLSAVSGNVVDKSSSGRLHLKAVSGDIKSNSMANDITISQVSGSVAFDFNQVDDLKIKTVSGDVDGELTLSEDGNIKVTGVSSDIDLSLQEDVSARFKLSASAGGKIKNNLTKDKAERAKYGPSSKLYFSTGNGSASVKANVISGRININKH